MAELRLATAFRSEAKKKTKPEPRRACHKNAWESQGLKRGPCSVHVLRELDLGSARPILQLGSMANGSSFRNSSLTFSEKVPLLGEVSREVSGRFVLDAGSASLERAGLGTSGLRFGWVIGDFEFGDKPGFFRVDFGHKTQHQHLGAGRTRLRQLHLVPEGAGHVSLATKNS